VSATPLERAVGFVEANGDALERARLRSLLDGEPPTADALALVAEWVPEASSLDTTCFRLAQLDDFPDDVLTEARRRARSVVAERQRADGRWEEDGAAWLYLTARCAFTLGGAPAAHAAAVLVPAVGADGRLPASLPAHWLAVPVLRHTWHEREAARICRYLANRLDELDPGSLAWLANALGPTEPVGVEARVRLAPLQRDDGSWGGDVQTTVAAMRALTD
jgi:hypothetical protein